MQLVHPLQHAQLNTHKCNQCNHYKHTNTTSAIITTHTIKHKQMQPVHPLQHAQLNTHKCNWCNHYNTHKCKLTNSINFSFWEHMNTQMQQAQLTSCEHALCGEKSKKCNQCVIYLASRCCRQAQLTFLLFLTIYQSSSSSSRNTSDQHNLLFLPRHKTLKKWLSQSGYLSWHEWCDSGEWWYL